MHYLDNAATTRVLPEAAEAAVHAMCEEFGNPSSLHRMGLEASHLLEDSRRTVASALGCLPEEVYFTACGTESTNISLRGAAHLNRHKKGRIITTEIETRGNRQHRKAACCGRLRRSFPCTGRNWSHHARGAERSTDRGHHSSLLPAGQQRSDGTAGRTAPESCSRPRHRKALFHIDAVQGLCRDA